MRGDEENLLTTEAATASPAVLDGSRVNPQWLRLLDLMQMNVRYERCTGVELHTATGDRILDFLSGDCVHNTGHNYPDMIVALNRRPLSSVHRRLRVRPYRSERDCANSCSRR